MNTSYGLDAEILFCVGPFRAGAKGIGHDVGYLEAIFTRVARIVDQFEAL